jgi:hypothetical protein
MSVFLMAFLMRSSLSSSPEGFLTYNIARYAFIALLSMLLLRPIVRYPLAAWRASLLFSVFEVLTIMMLDQTAPYFCYVLAFFSGCESVLYWRPKMYFDVTEVSNDRRVRYKSLGQIFIEAAKILMPVVLGIVITGSSYQRAATVIFVISIMQLLLSILFRPTATQPHRKTHSAKHIAKLFRAHASLRKILILQVVRGLLAASAGYIVVAQIHIYRSTGSDLDLGFYTAVASAISIVLLIIYRRLHKLGQKTIIYALSAPAFLLPLVAIFCPEDPIVAIVFYVFAQSVIESFFNNTLTVARIQGILRKHLENDVDRVEIEAVSEIFLSIGRITSQGLLLILVLCGHQDWLLPVAFCEGLLILPLMRLIITSKMRE